jgi:SAM-dependent methyltransferase
MAYKRTAKEVFDDWARDHHADGMERHHRPRVEQAWASLGPQKGDYLEIGVGNGYAIRHMATTLFAHGQCIGLDVSPHMVERTRSATRDLGNVQIECGDFLSWTPAEGRRFGLIFSMEVFYYFTDIQKGIEHAAGLLEPGGRLMVLVNYFREHEASHDWPEQLDTPMTLWSAEQYREGFRKAGLVDVQQQVYVDPPETAKPDDAGTLATWGRLPEA